MVPKVKENSANSPAPCSVLLCYVFRLPLSFPVSGLHSSVLFPLSSLYNRSLSLHFRQFLFCIVEELYVLNQPQNGIIVLILLGCF